MRDGVDVCQAWSHAGSVSIGAARLVSPGGLCLQDVLSYLTDFLVIRLAAAFFAAAFLAAAFFAAAFFAARLAAAFFAAAFLAAALAAAAFLAAVVVVPEMAWLVTARVAGGGWAGPLNGRGAMTTFSKPGMTGGGGNNSSAWAAAGLRLAASRATPSADAMRRPVRDVLNIISPVIRMSPGPSSTSGDLTRS